MLKLEGKYPTISTDKKEKMNPVLRAIIKNGKDIRTSKKEKNAILHVVKRENALHVTRKFRGNSKKI